ncbi:hypothetical protein PROFUN_11472 [Planoprotostelium fungivorum]|uniref:PX domain-containing protein n=1 Tax=Planoprotostelium fungivorum TaxID=1890364 RepID=A0A2P6N9W5_9EUKA|nr:hypothetical protein PROFUN_11472 [Planoprotostelium fungivorum]
MLLKNVSFVRDDRNLFNPRLQMIKPLFQMAPVNGGVRFVWNTFPTVDVVSVSSTRVNGTNDSLFELLVHDGRDSWTLRKRSFDISILHAELEKQFVHEILPQLPHIQYLWSVSPAIAKGACMQEEQRSSLQKYFSQLLSDPAIFSSIPIRKFFAGGPRAEVKKILSALGSGLLPSPPCDLHVPDVIYIPTGERQRVSNNSHINDLISSIQPPQRLIDRLSQPPPSHEPIEDEENVQLTSLLHELSQSAIRIDTFLNDISKQNTPTERYQTFEEKSITMEPHTDRLNVGIAMLRDIVAESPQCKCNQKLQTYILLCTERAEEALERMKRAEDKLFCDLVIEEGETEMEDGLKERVKEWEGIAEELVMKLALLPDRRVPASMWGEQSSLMKKVEKSMEESNEVSTKERLQRILIYIDQAFSNFLDAHVNLD